MLYNDRMKVIYDPGTDTLTIVLSDKPVAESDEDKPGIILDYDAAGNLISMKILDASQRVPLLTRIEYQVAPVQPA
jgi:YD repeat-containing protein